MAMVRFATTCDQITKLVSVPGQVVDRRRCGKRSAEYTSWPRCADCGEDTCPEHQAPGSDTQDERNECVCIGCQRFRDEEQEHGADQGN